MGSVASNSGLTDLGRSFGVKILVLCCPASDLKTFELNPTKTSVFFATDEMWRLIALRGISIDIVSMIQPVSLPLQRSLIRMKSLDEINIPDYDFIIHSFRDPTQPEIIEWLRKINHCGKPVLNNVIINNDFTKRKYLPILSKHGIGARIVSEPISTTVEWHDHTFNTSVSKDLRYIRTCVRNNFKHVRDEIITEFTNNSAGGIRSFFRIGFSMGKCCGGWLYASNDDVLVQKSGLCRHQIPFRMPIRFERILESALNETGIDLAHIEGCFVGQRLFIFDINPYPTSWGQTMTAISEEMVELLIQHFDAPRAKV